MIEQNITRAADRLATTQPAASNALKRLREAFNDELFVRSPHGMRPTRRAEELWPAVRRAMTMLEQAVAPENSFELAKCDATFCLAMADSTAALLLPGLMGIVKQEAPLINLRLVPLTSRDPRPVLLHGDVDAAVGSFPGVAAQMQGEQEDTSPVCHQKLYDSQYICVMRRGHSLAERELDLDAYCEAQHVLISFSGRARGPADDVLESKGRRRRIALTVNQYFTLFKVVSGSDLVAILPHHLVKANEMTDQLIIKAVPFQLPPVQIDMLWHARDTRKPAHRWLRRVIHDVLSTEVETM